MHYEKSNDRILCSGILPSIDRLPHHRHRRNTDSSGRSELFKYNSYGNLIRSPN